MSYVNLKASVAGLVAVCGLCLLLKVYHDEDTSHMDDHAVRVRSMDVVLELHRDNRVTVTERLQAEILDSRCSGLHRTLNLSPRTPVRMAEAPRLRVLEASIDGSPCPADDLQAHFGTQDVTVHLRRKDEWMSTGVHAFTLVYEVTGMIGFEPDADWITWNVAGSGWTHGVLAATCTVVPAEGAPLGLSRAFHGDTNSQRVRETPVHVAEARRDDGRTCFVYTAQASLWMGEEFTVAASFPKGAVPEPALYRPEADTEFTQQCAAACLFSLLLCLVLWRCWGQDPGQGPVAPRSALPLLPVRLAGKDGNRRVSPGLMNYLANDCHLEVQGLSAILLSLAAKGRCRLAGSDRASYSVTAVDPGPGAQLEPLTLEEVVVLDELPRTTVALDDVDPERWDGILHGCRQALREDYGALFRSAPLLRFIGFAVPFFLVAAIQLWHTQNLRLFGPAWPNFPWEAFLLLCALLVSGWGLSLAVPRQKALDSWEAWLKGLGVFLVAAGLLAALFLPLPLVREVIQSPFSAILPDATILQRACFFGTLLWPLFFGSLMQSRTEELADLQGQIAGFAKYIGSADASRIHALNPPGENLAEYWRLLPYACALGLEVTWTRRFERELVAAGEGCSAPADSAPWGFPLGTFSPVGFVRFVRDNI